MRARAAGTAARVRAKELRRAQTPAESSFWALLRGRYFRGFKFRRQVPIGPFVADFYCHRLGLIVELDGEVHAEPRQAAHDENRDIYLRSLGFRVLRFSNQRIFDEPHAVLREILTVVNG